MQKENKIKEILQKPFIMAIIAFFISFFGAEVLKKAYEGWVGGFLNKSGLLVDIYRYLGFILEIVVVFALILVVSAILKEKLKKGYIIKFTLYFSLLFVLGYIGMLLFGSGQSSYNLAANLLYLPVILLQAGVKTLLRFVYLPLIVFLTNRLFLISFVKEERELFVTKYLQLKQIFTKKFIAIPTIILLVVGIGYFTFDAIYNYSPKTHVPHYQHEIIELDDGRLLVVDDELEIYDPEENKFIYVGKLPNEARDFAAVKLKDGNVLFTGGYKDISKKKRKNFKKALIMNPKTLEFKEAGETVHLPNHYDSKMLLLPNDNVILFDGSIYPEIYDHKTQTFSRDMNNRGVRNLRFYDSINTDDGRMIIVKGDLFTYDYKTNELKLLADFKRGWLLNYFKLSDDEYMFIRGREHDRIPATTTIFADIYNIKTNTITNYDEFVINGIGFSVGCGRVVADPVRKRVYFIAGYLNQPKKGFDLSSSQYHTDFLNELKIYDIKTKKIKTIYRFLKYRRGREYSATLLKNGRLILIGGDNGENFRKEKIYRQTEIKKVNKIKMEEN